MGPDGAGRGLRAWEQLQFPGNGKNALRGFSARLQKRSETPALPARGISTGAKLRGDSSDVEVVEGVQLSEESH